MNIVHWHVYAPPHSKSNFYQKMGKFFAERIYQKQLPYLVNSSQTFWILLENSQQDIIGFSSFEPTKKGIEIGEIYLLADNHDLWKKLASKTIREAKKFNGNYLYTVVKCERELTYFLYKGFEVYKTTKNFFFENGGVSS